MQSNTEHQKTTRHERFEASRDTFKKSAYAIKVNDQWFSGFGNENLTKLRPGLCDAKLISGSAPQKVDDYLKRLKDRGYQANAVLITATP